MKTSLSVFTQSLSLSVLLVVANPSVADEYRSFCEEYSEKFASITMDAQNKFQEKELRKVRDHLLRDQGSFAGVANRMEARSKYLIGRGLSKSEVRANIFSLCLSLK